MIAKDATISQLEAELAKSKAVASDLADECRLRLLQRNRVVEASEHGTWIWEDGHNALESMSDGMVVVLTAGHLRRLIKEGP